MFAAVTIELSGGFALPVPPEVAFDLFSPEGERLWVPGWDPEILHPAGTAWTRGQIFRTREGQDEAVWVVTDLDRIRHEVGYFRVEAGRLAATVRVRCLARGTAETSVEVTYTFVGLSDAGNREIEAMSDAAFQEKMRRWQTWIASQLSGGAGRPRS